MIYILAMHFASLFAKDFEHNKKENELKNMSDIRIKHTHGRKFTMW